MKVIFKTELPDADSALPGRDSAMPITDRHAVLGSTLLPPYPENMQSAMFGMGCFWGVERLFWGVNGVYSTAVGYAAGSTPHPSYREVCTGQTGHNEVVYVVFDPSQLHYHQLLSLFWENHDPTQGMRQGNDRGTQYRSGIYVFDAGQRSAAHESQNQFQLRLTQAGFGSITTEIVDAPEFYFAEDYHQQYLHKNPAGYCGMGGTGVACPLGIRVPS